MDAAAFAELLNAKRIGSGRWLARCPAHDDRKPSLHVADGAKGVLLRCWSHGCTPVAICTAMGIRVADLFTEKPATPEQAAKLNADRRARSFVDAACKRIDREKRHYLWRYERLRDALGAKLLRHPEDADTAKLFHRVCDEIRITTPKVYPQSEDGPRRSEPAPETPAWIAIELIGISKMFNSQNETAYLKLVARQGEVCVSTKTNDRRPDEGEAAIYGEKILWIAYQKTTKAPPIQAIQALAS